MTSCAILFLRNGASGLPCLDTGRLSHDVSFVFICKKVDVGYLLQNSPKCGLIIGQCHKGKLVILVKCL